MNDKYNVLKKIELSVRDRLARGQAGLPLSCGNRAHAEASRKPFDLKQAFASPGVNVLAEVKLASPSEGDIALEMDPVEVARGYLANGAVALSVLTEPDYFKGSPEYLRRIRSAFPQARILMKDFVLEESQLLQALDIGADAVLLIVAMLGEKGVKQLLPRARALGLSVLVEVHDEEEMRIAAGCGADLIGVNNRNLKTMKVGLETSERLVGLAPAGATLLSESGIKTAQDIQRLAALGYRGYLIGTHFMRTGKPGEALGTLLKGCG